MTVSGDYEKILEDNLREELDWLEDEFELMFRYKKNYSKDDISLGNSILDNVVENIRSNENEEALNLLTLTLNRIEQAYPDFF